MGTITGQANKHKRAWASELQERRSKPRYPFEQALVFRRRGRQSETVPSPGNTLNMSSSGLLFEADSTVGLGEVLQIAVNWPAKLDNRCPLKIVVTGRVVRCSGDQTAVEILQYEWRTAGNRGLTR